MHKRLSLTIDEDLYISLKKKRVNVSRLVEKLLFKHFLKMRTIISPPGGGDRSSNLRRAISKK